MNFKLLLEIMKARYLLILGTLLVAVVSAAVLTSLEPKRYTASTSVVVNFQADSPFDTPAIPTQLASTYLETQLDIIRSQKVALRVVELRNLAKNAGWREVYAASGETKIPIENWIAAQIATNLEVEPLNNSRVVTIAYSALAPGEAAEMANAYAKAFEATTLDLTVEPARRNAAWFDQQLKVLRKRLETARTRVSDLQVQKGIVALDERLGTDSTRLDDITRNLVEAQMATSAARARQLGVNHPDYVSAVQRERALNQAMLEQKRNILHLQSQRDELDTLANEVDSEQQNYDATLQAYYKAALQGQFNQTNIAVLSPAFPPSDPSSPNVPLNMLSAIVLGLFLGLVLAVMSEMLNPKVTATTKRRPVLDEPTLPEIYQTAPRPRTGTFGSA
jgi:polysaccharide biosynthesis transport protein